MIARLSPEREAEIRGYIATCTNWSLDAIAVRDLLAELAAVRAERDQARARVAELVQPEIEAMRNKVRDSYAELIAAAKETKDYEGAFEVQCRLADREAQWRREDEAAS